VEIQVNNLDHLGIVAGIIDQIGLVEIKQIARYRKAGRPYKNQSNKNRFKFWRVF
jgi:hypothetical protein